MFQKRLEDAKKLEEQIKEKEEAKRQSEAESDRKAQVSDPPVITCFVCNVKDALSKQ